MIRTLDWPVSIRHDKTARADAVGQWEWTNLIPSLHRILANPAEEVRFPAFRRDFEHEEACGYWETAWYLMRRLMGWTHPGLGLRWWYSAGKPDCGDPRLRLLADLFDDRDQLDPLAMWAWDQCRGARDPAAPFLSERFRDDFFRRHPGDGIASTYDPYHGGSNPLHLGHSCYDEEPRASGTFLAGPPRKRRAVLVLAKAAHWHPALVHHGATLPRGTDWEVEVIVRPIGCLGTFRRSWVTAQWFQGKHSIHAVGCAPGTASSSTARPAGSAPRPSNSPRLSARPCMPWSPASPRPRSRGRPGLMRWCSPRGSWGRSSR